MIKVHTCSLLPTDRASHVAHSIVAASPRGLLAPTPRQRCCTRGSRLPATRHALSTRQELLRRATQSIRHAVTVSGCKGGAAHAHERMCAAAERRLTLTPPRARRGRNRRRRLQRAYHGLAPAPFLHNFLRTSRWHRIPSDSHAMIAYDCLPPFVGRSGTITHVGYTATSPPSGVCVKQDTVLSIERDCVSVV